METLRDIDLVRAVAPRTEFRADDSDDEFLGTMEGHFSVFGAWYEIDSMFEGQFLERVAPGAFKKTIAENRDNMRVLFDHGHDFQVGDKVLGPIRTLREDKTGPFYEVPLFDTSYNRDLLPGLRSDPPVYGSSFRFRVIKDEWNDEPDTSDHNPKGIPERTIKEARVFEFGPTPFPANPAATAAARSMTDEFYERLRSRNPQHYEELVERAAKIRTPQPPSGTAGAAASNPDEPPHGTRRTPAEVRQAFRRHFYTEGAKHEQASDAPRSVGGGPRGDADDRRDRRGGTH